MLAHLSFFVLCRACGNLVKLCSKFFPSKPLRFVRIIALFQDERISNPDDCSSEGFLGNNNIGYQRPFNCPPGYGKFTTQENLVRVDVAGIRDVAVEEKESQLRIGERVVILREGQPLGTVRWVDTEKKFPEDKAYGVEMVRLPLWKVVILIGRHP